MKLVSINIDKDLKDYDIQYNLEEFDIHYSSVCKLKNICLSHFPYLKRIYIGGYCISESTNIEIDNCNKLRDIELGLKGIDRSSYHSTEWKGELIISNCLVLKKLIIKSDKLVHTKGSITLQSIFFKNESRNRFTCFDIL